MRKTISVIIPVYNGARYIRDALDSVCTQSYLPKEVIVVDDASTDETCAIVGEYARAAAVPVKLLAMPRNTGGPYGPASLAAQEASGDFLTFLDDDDQFAPDAFDMLLRAYEADESVGVVIPDLLTFRDGTGETISPSCFARLPHVLPRVVQDQTLTGVVLSRDEAWRGITSFILPFRGLIARHVWNAMRGFSCRSIHSGDTEFTWRLVSTTDVRIRVVNRPLNRVRIREGSMSARHVQAGRELVRLYREMIRKTGDPQLLADLHRRLSKELSDLAYSARKERQWLTMLAAWWHLGWQRWRSAWSRPADDGGSAAPLAASRTS